MGAPLARIAVTRPALFICGENRLRSPTAERIFADWLGVETVFAGVGRDADNPLDPVLAMERSHRSRLPASCRQALPMAKVSHHLPAR